MKWLNRTKVRKLLQSVVVLSTLLLVTPSALAATVTGNVTKNGANDEGATVVVTCSYANNSYQRTTQTSSTGHYYTHFRHCPDGTTVNVQATDGQSSGSNTGVMGSSSRSHTVIDVPISNVSVPEFGLITATLAIAGTSLAVYTLRRRHLTV